MPNLAPFPFALLATGIGSMPHKSAKEAAEVVLQTIPDLPAWPQLPNRSPLEHMAAQFLGELPSVKVTDTAFYAAELPTADIGVAVGPMQAPGLYALLDQVPFAVDGLKGQVTGPITLAALLHFGDARSIHNPKAMSWVADHVNGVLQWQEQMLQQHTPRSLIFLDEPMLTEAMEKQWLSTGALKDVFEQSTRGRSGYIGLHCCGEPPWELLVELPVDVLSFDAYRYHASAVNAAPLLQPFMERGGAIAWGVVPVEPFMLSHTSYYRINSVVQGLLQAVEAAGVPHDLLMQRSMFTPACGLAGINDQETIRALNFTSQVANELRIMSTQQAIG